MYYRDIEEAESNLQSSKEEYLRRWGWEITCNTPGSHWLWRRDFRDEDIARHERWENCSGPLGHPSEPKPYGVITADIDLAVSITVRSLDEQPEIPEDEG